jgi:arylsulfatase A-like enzyme
MLGIWLGIAQGLAESAHRALSEPELPWRHAFWLAPAAYAAGFAAVGGAAACLPVRVRFRLSLFVMLWASSLGWLLLAFPQLQALGAVLLAAGLASQIVRLVDVRQAFARLLRPLRWCLTFALFATVAWTLTLQALDARHASQARPVPPPGARNVLLIVLDTVRAGSLGFLGYSRDTTPVLDKWSAGAIVFESAIATAPWTLPSHASMFTGRWAHELGAGWDNPLDGTFPTLAEVLRARGYLTGGFVANYSFTTRATGLARGFDRYEDFSPSPAEAALSTSLGSAILARSSIRNALQYHELVNRKDASAVNADFLDWLDGSDGRPFFGFLNYFDAHEPYQPPADARRFSRGPRIHRGDFIHHRNYAGHVNWWGLSEEQVAQEQGLYEAAIASIDHELGQLLDALDQRGILRQTVVIVTSDHGEHFGEHGLFNHGNSLYLPQLHVPLWILLPERTARRVSKSVSLRDLPTTILELADAGGASPFPGGSLARFWTNSRYAAEEGPMYVSLHPPPWAEVQPIPAARGPMRSIIEDPYHYILNGDGVEELYDYRADPGEVLDLAGTSRAAALLPRFRALWGDEEP